ncbi:DUF4190 domain-containing protein [Kitasatospora azatica]|uniref:DUF4190 domain-containing protein n=1 Tax=Kitasatospora azatica TaxID=58347 RepID=UPI00055E5BBB|nr:DUF4190 domain-containing protein [Kitasatospora azatica]
MSIPTNEVGPDAQAPEAYGYPPVAPQPQGKNGFAVASLVFGLIGGILFGLVFGFIGLSRAKKVGKGKAMAWVGIVLSILWIAPIAYFVPVLLKATDPGCMAAKSTLNTYNDSKLNADQNNPDALKTDLQTLTSQLAADSAKSNNSAAKTAIKNLSDDFQQLVTAINTGTVPGDELQAKINDDAKKIDTECGTIGS